MKVEIDGIIYVPISMLGSDANKTALAFIRAMTGGWHTNLNCHVEGGSVRPLCDCPACHIHRAVVQFLGAKPACSKETNPGFISLMDATR